MCAYQALTQQRVSPEANANDDNITTKQLRSPQHQACNDKYLSSHPMELYL